ncbi:hypothetical protein P4O66_011860 [Electrophorus voltai]|uniref:Uncharacterized protein n=1 Tax=Electrophorus voltai TaxID=2609070 RepID=A0AAD9DUC9_9TELE|nr:hypothetical protein P4O66_011860 [Electrophorus voltai]
MPSDMIDRDNYHALYQADLDLVLSVELDFKLQEDKLQPLMKRLCPTVDLPYTSLPYSQEVFTSTPKRKSKTEAKKHARWKLWFL